MNYSEKLKIKIESLDNLSTGYCKFSFLIGENYFEFAEFLTKEGYHVYIDNTYDIIFLNIFLKYEDQIKLFNKFIENNDKKEFIVIKKRKTNQFFTDYTEYQKKYVINFVSFIKDKNIRHLFGFQILDNEKLRIYKK
jgi:hypothetical protein